MPEVPLETHTITNEPVVTNESESNSPVVTNFGEMLSLYMRVNNISYRQMASRLNVSASTLHRFCTGSTNVTDSNTFLRVLSWLFEEKANC